MTKLKNVIYVYTKAIFIPYNSYMKVIQSFNRMNAAGPAAHRESNIAALLGVTIAFTAGSLGVIAFLVGLSLLGFDGGIVAANSHLFEQSLALVGYAIFAGVLVDGLRFLGDLVWQKNPDSG